MEALGLHVTVILLLLFRFVIQTNTQDRLYQICKRADKATSTGPNRKSDLKEYSGLKSFARFSLEKN